MYIHGMHACIRKMMNDREYVCIYACRYLCAYVYVYTPVKTYVHRARHALLFCHVFVLCAVGGAGGSVLSVAFGKANMSQLESRFQASLTSTVRICCLEFLEVRGTS